MIDPNVWVAAAINPYGTPARVVDAVRSDRVVAVVTQHLLDELAAVLAREKFRRWLRLADALAFVEALGGKAELHPDPGPPSRAYATRTTTISWRSPKLPARSWSPGTMTSSTPPSTLRRSPLAVCWRR